MMALVREWLLGITGAAILTALAEGAMPEGGVKQVGKLACGLVLLVAVLQPIGRWRGMGGVWLPAWSEGEMQQQTQTLQEEVDIQMRAVIEEELAAYSMDKAVQLGIECQVRVVCTRWEDGVFLPEEVQVWGVSQDEEQQRLAGVLEADLGLEPGRIRFQEGEAP